MPKHLVIDGVKRNVSGWKADRPDHRDLAYRAPRRIFGLLRLPKAFDLRSTGFLPKIWDQGNLSSCTMNATTSAMEFLYGKASKAEPSFSRLFGYYAERVKIENTPADQDTGAMIRDSMKSMATYGVCLEPTWPYDINKYSVEPPAAAWQEALNNKIVFYYRVPDLANLKQCLVEGYPVVIGFSVPESMSSPESAATGVVKYPLDGDSIVGGHAVMAVGYDDCKGLVTFQNSWGDSWGDKGFGYLPYAFFTNDLACDFWSIRTESGI